MALPNIVSNNLRPLGALTPTGPISGPPPGGHATVLQQSNSLPFVMHQQLQSNWCWAAVATSVSLFYDALSPWNSQCDLASSELSLVCCPVGSNIACDIPYYLDRALAKTNNYNVYAGGAASLAQIQAEIDAGRALGVRIGWSGGGGHFVVISGYAVTAAGNLITIEDPINNQSTLSYAVFQTAYLGTGSWTHSYWTQP